MGLESFREGVGFGGELCPSAMAGWEIRGGLGNPQFDCMLRQ